jgi:hypothetical protein
MTNNTWTEALRTYNRRHNNKFCIPKKDTDEFAKVKKIQQKIQQKYQKYDPVKKKWVNNN